MQSLFIITKVLEVNCSFLLFDKVVNILVYYIWSHTNDVCDYELSIDRIRGRSKLPFR